LHPIWRISQLHLRCCAAPMLNSFYTFGVGPTLFTINTLYWQIVVHGYRSTSS